MPFFFGIKVHIDSMFLPLARCDTKPIFKQSTAGLNGAACGVMIIIIGNGNGNKSSNPGQV